MTESKSGVEILMTKTHGESKALVERLFEVAKPGAVFSEPVVVGDYTLITASETSISMGFGAGFGGGSLPAESADEGAEASSEMSSEGGGSGGGGYAAGRAVAVISVGPEGVTVEPVFDLTKVALAFLTMLGSVFVLGSKMRKAAR